MLVLPDGLHALRTRFGDEDNRTALKAKCFAHFTTEVLGVWLRKQFIAIDKEQKCRRRLAHLSGVKELQTVSSRTDGLSALDGIVQGPIQKCGGNFLLELRGDEADRFQ